LPRCSLRDGVGVHSSISIDIAAPPDLVFALARDVERWPQLLPHYVRVDVEERLGARGVVARMVARRPLVPALGLGLPVAWRSRAWSEADGLRLRFAHRGGATDGMAVTWRIEPIGNGSRVTIEHDFRPRFLPWAVVVDRLFTQPIASRTLATFKAIAEAVAAATQSGEPRTTNRSA
jgi:ribosome-associated toxin RatA of RatAB toxin-antitoxin module